ncbi:hypothetical protein [Xenorhabdus cabanillasii]|uniref:hypothetical protein n=1 Tax=Xenorhabdus cabanillasii TaxID=351673 RepID=UPI000E22E134|nr:hypothetical protein [Xenorhabdus cabanillasii]
MTKLVYKEPDWQSGSLLSMLLGINERLLPLTGGQPLARQIRSRRICYSLAAATQLEIHWV